MEGVVGDISVAILAGGLGTRLRSVVLDKPKVLAAVGGRPFLSYLLDRLVKEGVREVVLLVGYAAEQVHSTFGDDHAGMKLTYSVESRPLGTAGAVRQSTAHFRESSLLLLNGDSFCEMDLPSFRGFSQVEPNSVAITLAYVPDAARYGRVELDGERIKRFIEKSGGRGGGWINAGIYMLPIELLREIAPDKQISLERELFPLWAERGIIRGFAAGGRFIDIGTPESYAEGEAFFLGQSARDQSAVGRRQSVPAVGIRQSAGNQPGVAE